MWQSVTGKVLMIMMLLLTAALQYSYWFGENGFLDRQKLITAIQTQHDENQSLIERNRILAAEVYDLKNGAEAVEEYARLDLGLIKPNETFVQMSMINGAYQPVYLDNAQQQAEPLPIAAQDDEDHPQ